MANNKRFSAPRTTSNLLEVQNAAKTMFANIRFMSIDDPIKSIVFTSSVPNEGKTTSIWYLAQAAATAGNKVLLVEADMRRRSLANMLQVHPRYGLHAVLSNLTSIGNAIMPTSVKNLWFMDAEPSIPNPGDILASKRMQALNQDLESRFDYVLYDTPPVGTFVDAAVLGSIADATIMTVRPDHVKRSEVLLAKEQLDSAGANVIGVCATFVEGSGSDYYYSYYTKHNRRGGDDAPMPVAPPEDQGLAGNDSAVGNFGRVGTPSGSGKIGASGKVGTSGKIAASGKIGTSGKIGAASGSGRIGTSGKIGTANGSQKSSGFGKINAADIADPTAK